MKILYPHITQNLGGVEKRFFTYFKYILAQNDNQYTVLISRSFLVAIGEDLTPKFNNNIIRYGFSWRKTGKTTRYIDYLYLAITLSCLRLKSFDVVHLNTSGARMFRNWFRGNVKFISAVTSPKDWLKREIASPRFIEMMSKGYGVDCLDSNICAAITEKYPNNQSNVFESPCSFISKSLIRNIRPLKEHSICFVGRLIPEKGANMLFDALSDIINRTSFKIYILGNGGLRQQFVELVKLNEWNERVVITYDPVPSHYMSKTEVFLSLQRDENYPSQSLLEAMACNNAIVATNVGLTNKLVTESNGILISNTSELVDALCRLENESATLHKMERNSYHIVKKNHTIEKFHKYLIGAYSKLYYQLK